MNSTIGNVTDANFASEVLESSSPVLVDYWAEWCGPCKMIEPALNEAAASYAGRVNIVRLNVDENQSTPNHYGVRGIPTLMLFRGGDIVATKVGALSKSQLADFLDSHL